MCWPDGGAASCLLSRNSTIAFKHAGTCGGLFAPGSNYINSTIIANNSATGTTIPCQDVFASFGTGTNNIVGVVDNNSPPGDTYIGDPYLTPLGNHGGSTPTHALSSNSRAIDQGNNANSFGTDQRGSGYPREVNGVADIGAYERQTGDDEIFYGGME